MLYNKLKLFVSAYLQISTSIVDDLLLHSPCVIKINICHATIIWFILYYKLQYKKVKLTCTVYSFKSKYCPATELQRSVLLGCFLFILCLCFSVDVLDRHWRFRLIQNRHFALNLLIQLVNERAKHWYVTVYLRRMPTANHDVCLSKHLWKNRFF